MFFVDAMRPDSPEARKPRCGANDDPGAAAWSLCHSSCRSPSANRLCKTATESCVSEKRLLNVRPFGLSEISGTSTIDVFPGPAERMACSKSLSPAAGNAMQQDRLCRRAFPALLPPWPAPRPVRIQSEVVRSDERFAAMWITCDRLFPQEDKSPFSSARRCVVERGLAQKALRPGWPPSSRSPPAVALARRALAEFSISSALISLAALANSWFFPADLSPANHLWQELR